MKTLSRMVYDFKQSQAKLAALRADIIQQLDGDAPVLRMPGREARKLTARPQVKRRKLSAATRLKMSQGAKARWALKRKNGGRTHKGKQMLDRKFQ